MSWFTRAAGRTRCQTELANNDDINASPMDADFNDMADGITLCHRSDGSVPASGDWDMGNFKITNYGSNGSTLAVTGKGDTLPTISGGSFTYTEQYCEYSRIGNQIMFAMVIQGFYAATPVGSIKITHLIPFTPLNLNQIYPCTVHHANLASDPTIQAGVNQIGQIELDIVTTNGVTTSLNGSDVNGLIIQVAVSGSFIKA